MAVGVADVCSVFSHEVRAPLSVLQGYLRLLRTSGNAPPDSALRAMLEATAQLAAIGHQASDLQAALERRTPTMLTTVGAVLAQVGQLRPACRIDGATALATRRLEVAGDGTELAGALATIADAVAREAEQDSACLAAEPAGGATIEITADGEAAAAGALNPETWFRRGGYGLTLLTAAVVLDAHRVSVDVLARHHLRLHLRVVDL